MLMKGKSTSQVINETLKDLTMLSRPNCKVMTKKNDILPFEDILSLEFLADKNQCGLFALGSHTKKRPHNLTLGRLYDGHILDIYEFGIESHKSIESFKNAAKGIGTKPIMLFVGDQWQNDALYTNIQNMLLDMFRGDKAEKISMRGIDHAISCTCIDGKIHIRGYYLKFAKTEGKVHTLIHLYTRTK